MIQYIIQTIYRFLLPFNASHGIRPDRFLDIPIIHLKRNRFAEIGIAMHRIDHGIMRMDILPQPFFRLTV